MTPTNSYDPKTYVSPWDPPRWVRRLRRSLGAVAIVALLGGVYLMMYGSSRTWIDADPANRVAFTTVAGREVLVLAYTGDGPEGLFDLPRYLAEPKRERVAAIDTHSRQVLWDTAVADVYAMESPMVLAADEQRSYVVTEAGLAILDTATGDLRVPVDEVPGIGGLGVTEVSAYSYDSRLDAIVALGPGEEVLMIPPGTEAAEPAPVEVADRWRRVLANAVRDPFPTAPGLEDGIDSPAGIHVRETSSDEGELMFHDEPSEGHCYDEVCYEDEDGVVVALAERPFWSW